MDECVVDSSAALAAALHEPGWREVQDAGQRFISSVNFAESVTRLIDRGHPMADALDMLMIVGLVVVDFDQQQAIEASRLRPLTREYGLSLGDRACLALASIRNLPVLTADRIWSYASLNITIKLIR